VLPRGGEIWIGGLIRALAALDFSAGAVRTLVSRMRRKGFLQSRRLGRFSFYRLTDLGLKEVSWGGERAFAPPGGEWDGRWTVVTYSVPEKHRRRRDVLRASLNGLGFGALAPGTWISPRPLSPEAERNQGRTPGAERPVYPGGPRLAPTPGDWRPLPGLRRRIRAGAAPF